LFSSSRKRALPAFPHRIGVLTSKSGAVINDFLSNIGHFGFEIIFVDTKVEGEGAIKDLLAGLRTLYKQDLDVLVVMRGGGSLESFQAFNNETIVRAISKFNVPVITGIGHDKDAPLVSLVSDINVSTPTAVANLITNSWRDAIHTVNLAEQKIFVSFESLLKDNMFLVDHARELLEETFRNIFDSFRTSTNRFLEHAVRFEHHITHMYTTLGQFGQSFELLFIRLMRRVEEQLMFTEKHIAQGNPERQLKLGWSIIKNKKGSIIRSVTDVSPNEQIDVVVTDGTIHTKVL
jgi:exodeoxyribonuclease VII large subunit